MITNNAKKIITANLGNFSGSAILTKPTSKCCLVPVKDIHNATRYVTGQVMGSTSNGIIKEELRSVNMSTSKYAQSGFAIGSGSTAPTENDYTLESQIYGNITATNPTTTNTVDGNKYICELKWTITNNTGSDITIREIGCFRAFQSVEIVGDELPTSSTYQMYWSATVMFDRIILDNPVTIANGSSGTVAYKFVYDWTEAA